MCPNASRIRDSTWRSVDKRGGRFVFRKEGISVETVGEPALQSRLGQNSVNGATIAASPTDCNNNRKAAKADFNPKTTSSAYSRCIMALFPGGLKRALLWSTQTSANRKRTQTRAWPESARKSLPGLGS